MAEIIAYCICVFVLFVTVALTALPLYKLRKQQLKFQLPVVSRILLLLAVLPGSLALFFNLTANATLQPQDFYRTLVFCGCMVVFPALLILLTHAWASWRAREKPLSQLAGFLWSLLAVFLAGMILGGLFFVLMAGAIFSSKSSLFT